MKKLLLGLTLLTSMSSFANDFTVSVIQDLSETVSLRMHDSINGCTSDELSSKALTAYVTVDINLDDMELNAKYEDISSRSAFSVASTYARSTFNCIPTIHRVIRNSLLKLMKEKYQETGKSDWGHSKKMSEIY